MATEKSSVGKTAMILAAGLGTRMRPLTNTTPKPLIKVAGKSIIDHTLDRLRAAKVARVVVNMHHHAEQIEQWAEAHAEDNIVLSDERDELLETGGGVVKALAKLGKAPFFVFNSDSFWIDGPTPALTRMREAWDGRRMDCLLLLAEMANAVGFDGPGDFTMDDEGRLVRREESYVAPFVYAGCCLVSPRLFADTPDGAFSMNVLWNRALAKGRLFGLRHDSKWLHVGTPEAIGMAENVISGRVP
jgi:MurNAc alpha-1-phosphate uridylyltransferase